VFGIYIAEVSSWTNCLPSLYSVSLPLAASRATRSQYHQHPRQRSLFLEPPPQVLLRAG